VLLPLLPRLLHTQMVAALLHQQQSGQQWQSWLHWLLHRLPKRQAVHPQQLCSTANSLHRQYQQRSWVGICPSHSW
jgi:hypothetical protein